MFEPKIKIYNSFLNSILARNFIGITLAPFGIYVREWVYKYGLTIKGASFWDKLINHEKIHWKQQLEMLIIFFYLWYLIEYLIKRIIRLFTTYEENAYKALGFEREARSNEKNLKYLSERKHYAWIKYIFK